jgi:hypothetical protein
MCACFSMYSCFFIYTYEIWMFVFYKHTHTNIQCSLYFERNVCLCPVTHMSVSLSHTCPCLCHTHVRVSVTHLSVSLSHTCPCLCHTHVRVSIQRNTHIHHKSTIHHTHAKITHTHTQPYIWKGTDASDPLHTCPCLDPKKYAQADGVSSLPPQHILL